MSTVHPIPDDALDADIAILGKKGRGKSYTAKGVVERLLDLQRRVLVLDPLSTWWGLRSGADGETEGYPVAVIGGPKGDMPLSEAMGTPLARIIAENNIPMVIDMGEMRKAAWQRLVGDLLEELWTKNRDPLWIVLEEADVFAPQTPGKQDASTRVLGEVDRIARRGRAFGFRLISITQRPAKINKDVLTQLSTLVSLGITSPQDRDAIKSWVDGNADSDSSKEVMDSLASLKVGEGWVWSPDHGLLERVNFPPIRTLDTSKTPKAGERRLEPKRLAEVDLSAVQEALAIDDTPTAPEATAKPIDDTQIKRIETAAYDRGYRAGKSAGYAAAVARAGEHIAPLATWLKAHVDLENLAENAPPKLALATPVEQPARKTGLPTLAGRYLTEICVRDPVRLSWAQVATLIQRKPRGGAFNAARKFLLDDGYVTESSGRVVPSPKAFETIGIEPQTGGDMVAEWLDALPTYPKRILRLLLEFPEGLPVEEVAFRLDRTPSGGAWNSAIKILKDNELIRSEGGTFIAAMRAIGKVERR